MENHKDISSVKLLWKMTRPHTLTATFSPVILGTVTALYETRVDWLLFIAMMLACLALQIATNLFNEYYDFKRGLDTAESVGIGGGIVRHGLKPKNILTAAYLLYATAALTGVYICINSSWWFSCQRFIRDGGWLFIHRRSVADCVYAIWRVIFRLINGDILCIDRFLYSNEYADC